MPFRVSDGTIMLSLTGVFCLKDEQEKVVTHFQNENILNQTGGFDVDGIDVPVLTTKERLHLESLLPCADWTGNDCLPRLGVLGRGRRFGRSSGYKMQQYAKYYRFYPFFGRLVP